MVAFMLLRWRCVVKRLQIHVRHCTLRASKIRYKTDPCRRNAPTNQPLSCGFFDARMVKWRKEPAELGFAAAGRAGSLADALCFHRSDNWGLSLHIFMVRLVLSVDM